MPDLTEVQLNKINLELRKSNKNRSRSPVGAPGRGSGGPFYGAQPLQPTQTRAPTGERLHKISDLHGFTIRQPARRRPDDVTRRPRDAIKRPRIHPRLPSRQVTERHDRTGRAATKTSARRGSPPRRKVVTVKSARTATTKRWRRRSRPCSCWDTR